MPLHYFFQKAPLCGSFGTENNGIIRAFVCLRHLASSLMPLKVGKVARLEFAMGNSNHLALCTNICTQVIMKESSPIKQMRAEQNLLLLW